MSLKYYSMATTELDFSEWLETELKKKDWIPAQLAKAADIGADVLSRILNRERGASSETLVSIANALGYPPEFVFRMAGILPIEKDQDPTEEELLYLYNQLNDQEKQEIREWVRFKAEKKKKE